MSRFESPSPTSRSTSVSRRLSDPRLLGPARPLRAERAHQRRCRIGLARCAERLQLVACVACRLDRRGRRLWRESARKLEPRLCNLEPESEPSEPVDGALKKVDGVRVACRAGDPASSEADRGLDAFSARGVRRWPRAPRRRRRAVDSRSSASRAWTSCSRSGAASRFVHPTSSNRAASSASALRVSPRARCIATAARTASGSALESGEEVLCLVEATLEDADLGEPRGRRHAARSLARLGQLPDGRDELRLGGVDATVRREDVGAARATEREQRDVVVLPHELVENLAPLLRPLGVASPLAREHQRAADVGERLEARRLAARRGGHRLVEMSEALVDLPERDLGEAELRQRAKLEVRVAGCERDLECRALPAAPTPAVAGRVPNARGRAIPARRRGRRPEATAPRGRANRRPPRRSRTRVRTPARATARCEQPAPARRRDGTRRTPARDGRRRRAPPATTTARDRARRAPRATRRSPARF